MPLRCRLMVGALCLSVLVSARASADAAETRVGAPPPGTRYVFRFHGPGGPRRNAGPLPAGLPTAAERERLRRIVAEELLANARRTPAGGRPAANLPLPARAALPVSPPASRSTPPTVAPTRESLELEASLAALNRKLDATEAQNRALRELLATRPATAPPPLAVTDRRPVAAGADTTVAAGADTAAEAWRRRAALYADSLARLEARLQTLLNAPAGPPSVIREQLLDTGMVQTNLILFETGQTELLAPSRRVAVEIGNVLIQFAGVRVLIVGHTDSRGSAPANLDLSRRRAAVVRQVLIEACGFAADQIEVEGLGESEPLIDGNTPTRLALNRRVEFRILNPGGSR